MSFVPIALTLLGTGLQVFGQLKQAKEESEIFEYNAAVQRQQADLFAAQGELEAKRQRRQAAQFTAAQKAAYVGAGVNPYSTSPAEVMVTDAAEMVLDARIIEYNAKLSELNAMAGADMSLVRAQQARSSGFLTAGTTLLSGITRASMFAKAPTKPKPDLSGE